MLSKSKRIQQLVEFLIDNAAILLTIAFAGYVIYRQEMTQSSVSTEELLTAILGVLGLLAISEIVERYHRLNHIKKSSDRTLALLESRFTDRASAIAFFQKPPGFEAYINAAHQIDMCGVSLTSTINKQFSNLREALRLGSNIRVLIVDPDSLGLQMSAARSEEPEDVDYFRRRLDATFRDLEYLHKSWIEYKSDMKLKVGTLSVRLVSYAPSFGIISFDPNRRNGAVFLEIYPHRYGYGTPPTFDLNLHRDGEWYKYFIEQFEQMWKDAKPWQPISSQ